ncbi:YqgE/AlgH family protein [Haloechinothrix sp. LS1_15]|uniref:YqgE/AlgH family protein n=1 Tax=Haloechinothrix sp. LS1_15 TaxID=2652248 RepID=UPI00294788B3|nr:YqgE/AlgH family protein [Haloechinothrix sp. LS1_15]MDV6010995.1 YqgE/AlgH family protein [Haloechinothrix sp. LS1_15]
MVPVRAISDVEQGSLLVADPSMSDPNFRRTVVYVLHHSEEGTLGVVLNRPSEIPVDDVLPSWAGHVVEPASVFVGGPVEQDTPLCLAALRTGERASAVPGTIGVRGPVALVVLDADPDLLVPRLRGMRVFAGYAGWSVGQLDSEIQRGDWLVVPALPADVLASPDTDLWGHVLRRQGVPTALLATHPGDLQLN